MSNIQEVVGADMIDKEKFNLVWDFFKETFTNSDADMLQGYMILKAACAILEQAFGIDPVEAVAEAPEEGDDV